MTRQNRFRAFSLLLLLGLTAGILLAPPAADDAYALPCCSYCDTRLFACEARTIYPECYGNSACCMSKLSYCYKSCLWC